MRTFKLYLLLAAVLTALCFTLFIIVSAVSSIGQDYDLYKSLSPDNMSQFKKTNFITSYTYLTGDYSFAMSLGYEKSTIESLVNQQYGSQSNASSYGDYRDLMTQYFKELESQGCTIHYVYGGRFTLTRDITLNGKTLSAGETIRKDCSGITNAFRYFTGADSQLTDWGSNTYKNNSTSISSGTTWGSLSVGDIISRTGHVAAVIAIDNEYVYVANSGGSGDTALENMRDGNWSGSGLRHLKSESISGFTHIMH